MLTVTIPGLRLVSEANVREHHHVRAKRTKHQRAIVGFVLATKTRFPETGRLVVTIVRLGVRLMDSDNAVGSAKHVRDAVALWLGRDDSERGNVEWRVEQRKAKTYGVEIRIETAEQARGSRREEAT